MHLNTNIYCDCLLREWTVAKVLNVLNEAVSSSCADHANEHFLLLREQVEPLLLGDRFLSEQLENDGTHQIPLVLKLQGPLVLEEKYGMDGGGMRNRKKKGR